MPDDYTSNPQTAGRVAVGGSATGEIESSGDQDWYAVTLEAGTAYRIDLEGSPTGAGTLYDPYLRGVYDAAGNLISGTPDDDGGEGYNSRLAFTPDAAGTYYIAAGAYRSYLGTYRVSVTEEPVVAVGGSATGRIGPGGDRDWFAVTLEAGRTYRIDLEGWHTGAGTLRDPHLRGIYDADGTFIPGTTNDDGGVGYNSRVEFTADADAVYHVAAGGYEGPRPYGGGTYTVSVIDITDGAPADPPDDFTADTGTTGTVAVGGSATGRIGPGGDRDWFAVTLEAGRTYRIDLEGWASDDGTLGNPYLRGVYAADGTFIPGTTNDDDGVGDNSRLEFTADADAVYYVAAGAYNANYAGTYTVSVTDVTDNFRDDFTAGAPGAVAVGGSATGRIDYDGDQDWFAVTLEAGRTYRIDLAGSPPYAGTPTYSSGLGGWVSPDGTLPDPYLRGVYDANGNLLPRTTNDGGAGLWRGSEGNDLWLEFTAGGSGVYYVAAGAHRQRVGTYTVSVTDVTDGAPVTEEPVVAPPVIEQPVAEAPADLAADRTTAGTVAVGGSVAGEIESSGDRDWFAVTLEAGRTYRFDLEGWHTGAGTLRDPHLRGIYDADGTFIPGTTDGDGGVGDNSRVEFTADADAVYYVAAGGYEGPRPYGDGDYTLSVTDVTDGAPADPPDDFTADTGTTGTVAVGGSATGRIGPGFDRDWFAVTLEAGRTYRIDLEGWATDDGTLSDPYLRGVYAANGTFIPGTTDDDGGVGDNSRLEFTADADAVYYVAAGAYNANYAGTYTVSVTDVTDNFRDDFTAGAPGAVAVGGSATGRIDYDGDQDWFAVTLEAGRTYRIDLAGSPPYAGTPTYSSGLGGWVSPDGTLPDPYLRGVYDANGNLLPRTTNDGGTGLWGGSEGNDLWLEFTAGGFGVYYVAAGAHGQRAGTYTVSVTDVTVGAPAVPPPDLTADTGTAGTVAVGGSATSRIDSPGDRDWFAVTLEAGKTYRIDLEGYQTGAGTLPDPYLRGVYDAEGNLIPGTLNDDGGEGYNNRMVFTPHEDAVYHVAAGASGDHVGTYALSVIEEPVARPPADLAADTTTAGTVAVGGSVAGALETAHDRDWYAVTLEAGTTYRIDLEGYQTGGGTLHDPYLRGVYDADGNLIPGTTDDDGGERYNSRLAFTPDADGTYYLSAGAYASWFGTYTLSVTEQPAAEAPVAAPPDDLAADTATTGAVAVGGSAAGEIETAGDRDWYAVTLEAGTTYRIDLEGWETDAGTLPDPYLRGVYDAEGNLVPGTLDNNGGVFLNSRLAFTPDAGGTYYLSAGAYGSGSGTYTVSVTEQPAVEAPDDFTDDTGTTGTVAVGGSAAGEIETAGDRDWFAVTLEAGTAYRIDLEGWATGLATGWATGGGTLPDPYLRGVYDAEGNLVPGTLDDDGGVFLNSRLAFTPDADGTYYLSAGAWSTVVGTYRVSVTEQPAVEAPADLAADTTTTGAVAVGGSAAGEIETAGDRDWYAVTLEAGTAYRIDLEGSPTHGGTLSDPYLRGVYDADGNLVPGTPDDDGGQALNSRLEFTPDADGTYYIEAGAYSSHTGTYTLSVEEGL